MDGSQPWLVVMTQPLMERRAINHLRDQGIRVYCPFTSQTYLSSKKNGGRLRARTVMLFQGYMFAQITKGWQSIKGTVGVSGILQFGDDYPLLPHLEIERMMKAEVGGLVVIPPPPPRFAVGSKVRVTDGPLLSRLGTVEGSASALGRVKVMMSLLGRKTSVEIDEQLLEAA